MHFLFIFALMVVMLSGCATTYQPTGFTGGYSETRLGENIFQVSFRGNGFTSPGRASDFTLLRSAETTLENGFRYFAVVESERDSKIGTYTTPTTSQIIGNTITTTGGQTYFFSKPRASNTILCFERKPATDGLIFDAEFIVRTIRQKYNLNE